MTKVHGEAAVAVAPGLEFTVESQDMRVQNPSRHQSVMENDDKRHDIPKSAALPQESKFMHAAIESALEGVSKKEGGPFGAAIVCNGKLVCVGHNTVLKCTDSTNHAEMNVIREAARIMGSHDLSDCDLYATCEPCPMCWGACNWARIRTVYIGANRVTAALYGFDDDFFYQELDLPKHKRTIKHVRGILEEEVTKVLQQTPTYRRRMLSASGMLGKIYESMFGDDAESEMGDSIELEQVEEGNDGRLVIVEGEYDRKDTPSEESISTMATSKKSGELNASASAERSALGPRHGRRHEIKALNEFMQMAIDAALEGMGNGHSKEREPFGAVIIKEGKLVAKACNTVLRERDPTATAEINAIRAACAALGTYNLDGCELYTTVEPDVMSLGAIYWSRVNKLHVGVSLRLAALYGFEDGILHYKDLAHDAANRGCRSVYDISPAECESVFRTWKESEGIIY